MSRVMLASTLPWREKVECNSTFFIIISNGERTMPANKNALIRYKTIDRCLRNRYRRWTLDDLVDACCDTLYDMEGISKGVCARTVQMDIQIMRSDKLGYNAPIVVYDKIYYTYADPDYSITEMQSYDAMMQPFFVYRGKMK